MHSRKFLCIEVGSTRTKAALFDEKGNMYAHSARSTELSLSGDFAESDPIEWLQAAVAVGREAAAGSGCRKVDALCIASCGPTTVVTDRELMPLREAMLWMDYRAAAQAQEISRALGRTVNASWIAPKLLWMKRYEPDIYRKIACVMQPLDFISSTFTGIPNLSVVSPNFTAVPGDMWKAAGLPARFLPPLRPMGQVIGPIQDSWARMMGLSGGFPVISGTGGVDAIEVVLGTGVLEEGLICNKTGTSEGIEALTRFPVSDERLFIVPHPIVDGAWHIGAAMSEGGKSIEWFVRNFYSGNDAFDCFTAEASRAETGSRGLLFLPYLTGERAPHWNENARGVFFGLSSAHDRGHMARAVLEGIALGVCRVLEILRGHGCEMSEMRVAGKPSLNMPFNQIKADVTGLPVRLHTVEEVELLGLAIICARALNVYSSWKEAAGRMVTLGELLQPDGNNYRKYERHRELYGELYRSVSPLFGRLQ